MAALPGLKERIKRASFLQLITSPKEVARKILEMPTNLNLGFSGFAHAGYPKTIPIAMADIVESENLQGKHRYTVFNGASVGAETQDRWAGLGMIERYYGYQTGKNIAAGINRGDIIYKDIHLSNYANYLAWGMYKRKIDVAILEASEITKEGYVIPTAACGIAQEAADQAEKIFIEVNTSVPSFQGMYDVVEDLAPPNRRPNLISRVDDRVGVPFVRFDPDKVVGIVECPLRDHGQRMLPSRDIERKIAGHILEFLENEVKQGRVGKSLLPLQSGVGSIANAVMQGFLTNKTFSNLTMWTEVLQDTTLDLFDSGKLVYASGASLALTSAAAEKLYANFNKYRERIVLRPQAVTNHPEVVRRIGVISMNTPVEFDLYGHANSTHTNGTKIINGIGGSGDFLRNAFYSILHTPSTRPSKTDPHGISTIVPFCSHIDHTEHDVFVYVTEQGLADLRGLSPRQRTSVIIDNCVHPEYRDQLTDYVNLATKEVMKDGSGHIPHLLSAAFKMHTNFKEKGTMKVSSWV